MKKTKSMIITTILSIITPLMVGLTPILVSGDTAYAADTAADQIKSGADKSGLQNSKKTKDLDSIVQKVVNGLLFLIGIAAIIAIIVAGFMYVASAGDPSKTKKAKDTIMYAVIGIVVAVLSYAIVNWVVGLFE